MEPLRPLVQDDPEWIRLAQYLRDHLPAAGLAFGELAGPMDIAQFPGGHSNLTYLVRFGASELVVRRPPAGLLPPKAHDVAREYRWLRALQGVLPLAPRPYLLCDDPNVIGSVFYVMERRVGQIVRWDEPPALATPAARRLASQALVDALVTLHAVDISSGDLATLGKPAGFMERQVRGWTDRWHKAQTTLVPNLDAVARWLLEHVPPDPEQPAIVHGDYKLDNVVLGDEDPARVIAVLDWEMTTLGDPLADLGILLAYWGPTSPPGDSSPPVFTTRPGWFTPEEIIERYAEGSGRDVSNMQFYQAFALFKVAIVIQQLFARYLRGETKDDRFARFDERVGYLAARAAGWISAR